jgi:D-3-phosphoglycerate dehydrogenase
MDQEPRWRIQITDGLAGEGVAILRQCAEVIEEPTLRELGTLDAVVVRGRTKIDRAVLEAGAPRLKVVGRAGVGVDNIDVAWAHKLGVKVVNAPEASTVSVAELALGLMLALARRIPEANASMQRGEWRKRELTGSELSGRTLGIVGVGRIGGALAERAAALGMRLVGFDVQQPPDVLRSRGVEPVDLPTLLSVSDYISLHVPLTPETEGMIDAEALALVKPGARLICTARGRVVCEEDLLEALDKGRLAGAALDVFAQEPPGLSPLVQHPRVITTPHIGAQTGDAQRKAAVGIAEEVLAALHGKPLRWLVR